MIAYLHGFASGPGSFKARHFERRFADLGIELVVPELDGGDFERLTLSGQLDVVARTCAGARPPVVLIGSSMGAWVAALYAAAHPVDALVLLAPAIDFPRRWRERLGEETLSRWRDRGALPVFHHGLQREAPVGYALMADAEAHDPWPPLRCPALLVAGRNDDLVPVASIEHWSAMSPAARLIVLDTGHEMVERADELFALARRFLAAIPAVASAYPSLADHP